MSIRETLPKNIIELLKENNIASDKIDLSLSSDIDTDGGYGKQWVIVADRKLLVYSNSSTPRELNRFDLNNITEIKSHNLVGGQVLEVSSDGTFFETVHYTNSQADKFSLAVKIINDMLRNPELKSVILDEWIAAEEEKLARSKKTDISQTAKRKTATRLIQMATPYMKSCIVMFILLLIGVTIDLTPPYLTRTLVDDVLGPNAQHPMWLMQLVIALLGIQLARIVITVVNNRINTRVGNRFVFDLRAKLFNKLQRLSIDFFDRKQVGGLMSRVSADTEVLQSFISNISQGFLLNIVLIFGIGTVLFSMNWRLGLFVLIPGPLVMVATRMYWKHIIGYCNRYWFSRWRINSFLSGSLSGIRVVKAFAQEQREINEFKSRNNQLMQDALAINQSWSTFFPIMSMMFSLGGILVWYVGGHFVLIDDAKYHISLGTLIAFLSYLGMFYGPLSSLAQLSQWATQVLTAAHRIFEILDEEEESEEDKDFIHLNNINGKIEFKNVFFGYVRYLPVLQDISFAINPGEKVGIIGHSGSGKTTIANLICRFYEPTSGQIFIDDTDITLIDKTDLRNQIGVVLQDPYLFRGTIAQNIAYAKPNANMDEIIQAAKIANAHDFIVHMPDGYDTRIGERGAGLSGGERQRLSIARVVLRNPRILVMDEATSSIDAASERLIQNALSDLIKNRTTFIIAHRLSTIMNVDKVIVIKNGILKEFGPPKELIKIQNGYYSKFVRIQSDLFKLKSNFDMNNL